MPYCVGLVGGGGGEEVRVGRCNEPRGRGLMEAELRWMWRGVRGCWSEVWRSEEVGVEVLVKQGRLGEPAHAHAG